MPNILNSLDEESKKVFLERLVKLYRAYAHAQTDENIQELVKRELYRIDLNPSLGFMNDLYIELPIEEIEEIFKKYGVIQLRSIDTSTHLLLGCGNCPIDPRYGGSEHNHEGYITINPELSMNPTVIGAFGINPGLAKLLPEAQYNDISLENMFLDLHGNEKEIFRCMTTGYKVYELDEDVRESSLAEIKAALDSNSEKLVPGDLEGTPDDLGGFDPSHSPVHFYFGTPLYPTATAGLGAGVGAGPGPGAGAGANVNSDADAVADADADADADANNRDKNRNRSPSNMDKPKPKAH